MKLDEAIKHCKEVAATDCTECGKEHAMLAAWLTEYKCYLYFDYDVPGHWIETHDKYICSVCGWEYSDELPFMSNNGCDKMQEAFAHCPHCGVRMFAKAGDENEGD